MEEDWSSLLVTERRTRIVAALERFRGHKRLYLDPEIPPRKLANARAATLVPKHDRVIALIDCTIFGSAKNCIVFGEDAVYVHNSRSNPGTAFRDQLRIDYPRLLTLTFSRAALEVHFTGPDVKPDDKVIQCGGSGLTGAQMVEVFVTLQASIRHGIELDERPSRGFYIPSHLIERGCLDPTNDHWPSGIATLADASVIAPPLVRRWEVELETNRAPAIVRDFVIVVGQRALIGLELTTGREYWRRELADTMWGRPVSTHGLILIKGGAYWHAFELETGEPRDIDVPALSRAVRDQLVLADVRIPMPWTYAAWSDELRFPGEADGRLLIAANRERRLYAYFGLAERRPSLWIADERGVHHLQGAKREDLTAVAMTDRYVLTGMRTGEIYFADTEQVAWTSTMETHVPVEQISVGSDHVVTAGGGRMRCYRSS